MTYPMQGQPASAQWAPYPPQQPWPQQPASRFSGLAWTAVILGIIGVVGSPVILLNNLTAVVAAVGVVLGLVALFGTRKVLAAVGVALCVAAITFTVMAQGAAVAKLDQAFGNDPAAAQDVTVANCAVVSQYGNKSTQATIKVTNPTAVTQTYSITISVNDKAGARIGEINAFSNSLAAGQSATLTGLNARGLADDTARPGPASCTVADVNRFAS